jgi:isopenicillin-N N-acyltransferase-like protein
MMPSTALDRQASVRWRLTAASAYSAFKPLSTWHDDEMNEIAAIGAPYRLIDVEGGPYERGVQFGRACSDLIARYPDVLRAVLSQEARLRDPEAPTTMLSRDELARRALRFLPAIERFSPDYVAELRGVAAGAELPFELALLANVRGEVGLFDRKPAAPVEGCTAFAVGREATADGGVLIGQNQDQSPLNEQMVVVLRVTPDRGPRILTATFAGLLGYGGINSAGIGIMQNALATSAWKLAMPHYPMKRAFLEQDRVAACVAIAERVDLASSGNYVLVDRERAICLETTPDGHAVLDSAAGRIAHTNNFIDATLARDDRLVRSLPDSCNRLARMESLLRASRTGIRLEDAMGWLRDHADRPRSICRHFDAAHGNALKSIYAIICEPDKGRLHITRGNPCSSAFFTYKLD